MYDLIVIGAGPAGLSAAIYARRFLMKTLVIGQLVGGLITTAGVVENWPGEVSITGVNLMKRVEAHARSFNAELIGDKVVSVKRLINGFSVKSSRGSFRAKCLVFATGAEHRKLGVPGEGKYFGRGVSYCAACDGLFFKDQVVAVIGGSDTAAKEALLLTQFAKRVYIIYRGERIHPEPVTLERVRANKKIKVINNAKIVEVVGDERQVSGVRLDTGRLLRLGGVFVAIGLIPRTELAASLGVKLNKSGEIIVDKFLRTSVPGVFAAGDCTNGPFKQAITGAADGVIAAYSAYDYLNT